MVDIEKIVQYSQDLTLLYVEDNEDAREMTTMILEDFFDNIIVAVDGKDGYEKFKQNSVDIIITDINMPNLNGLEMCEKIRKLNSKVSIIVLSAHNEGNYFIESIRLGINGYLLKPIDISQLSDLIFRVLQKYKYIYEAKSNLKLLEEYKKATNHSAIVSKTNLKGIITYVNDSFCEISGYKEEELIGKNHNIVRHPDNPKSVFEDMWHTIRDKRTVWKGLVRNRAKNGKSYYVDSVVMPIIDLNGDIIEYISLRHDVTDVMNPYKQFKSAIANAANPILIYIKLDKFDMTEEFYDNNNVEMIQESVTYYLQKQFSNIYEFDKIYHLGHGEYALILEYEKYSQDIQSFKNSLINMQNTINDDIVHIDDIEYDISVLISLAYEKDKIIESAKLGIKRLIKTNKEFIVSNKLAIYEQEKAKENMRVISLIKQAIKDQKIVSYFQPIIDNKTKKIVKYESLVRLIDNNDKVLSPFFFLEIAKKSNHYSQITNIVLEHSFESLKSIKKYDIDISINLSAIDIEQKSIRKKILELLESHKACASRIVFELLEDEVIKDFKAIHEFIKDVKAYGVKIAIDDFGAGHSNYERLYEYQPDILKIDGCLIRNIESSNYSLSVVKSIVTFAKEQNIQIVAEYIENEAIFNIVKELGVDFSQGYYFGKPEPMGHYITTD